jgi:hypothetical protein
MVNGLWFILGIIEVYLQIWLGTFESKTTSTMALVEAHTYRIGQVGYYVKNIRLWK